GGAQVSQKHCGFIVNTGNATCADVLCLADTVCKIVTDETGFQLEKEVRVVK
ncbi:MAG: UDP-N-acetylenolpyruvoylglucosamine reductase, partial [Ruthenibacterium lactatiformans]|nr:UDP-N-acetylenolpyruvoylglucosamine reductase [Ruthenibacterium lactatiformans]